MNFLAKCFLVFSLCFFMYCFATDPVVVGSEPNPLDLKTDRCLCGDLSDSDAKNMGEICMCESTPAWPGKVLVIFLNPEWAKDVINKAYGLEVLTSD